MNFPSLDVSEPARKVFRQESSTSDLLDDSDGGCNTQQWLTEGRNRPTKEPLPGAAATKVTDVKRAMLQWPVVRQATSSDRLGRGAAAQSRRTAHWVPRTRTADRVVGSVCPYCAVGCGQLVYVKDEKVVQVEGDPNSPISRGRLCPKGSASLQLTTGPGRVYKVRYRRPQSADWEDLDLDTAMDMIADRVIKSRREFWQDEEDGKRVNRTMGIASLGGATLDNEENYLMKKLYTAMGAIQIENQARI
jgi:formate dehydrogenase major subunit